MRIDAVGRSCPEPVLMLRKELKNHPATMEIAVDNAAARENCGRLAAHEGYRTEIKTEGPIWVLTLTK